jgi:hypothetical protein
MEACVAPSSKWIFLLAVIVASCASPAACALEPLATYFGFGDFLHPMQPVAALPYPKNFDQLCCCRKEQVHIFGVNGLVPMCTGNFNGLCRFFRDHGFANTYFDQLYTCHRIPDRIRAIRRHDPNARIVLIGFSLGCNSVRSIANELSEQGVQVDLMIYLVGDLIRNTPYSQPAGTDRIVNVRSRGLILLGGDLFFNGADLDFADNYLMSRRHILVPSRTETQELCMFEVLSLMCRR